MKDSHLFLKTPQHNAHVPRLANDSRQHGYGVQGEVDQVSVSFEIQEVGTNQSFGLKLEVV